MMTRVLLLWVGFVASSWAADWEREPILYSTTKANNRFARFQEQIAAKKQELAYDDKTGYLPALLKALEIPESSQVLVFSKTSLQRSRISPSMPRAIYFNDDIYVGFCQRGDVLEIAVPDPQLGTVFYSVGQKQLPAPRINRHNDNCLLCHGSSLNSGIPGHLVRSMVTDREGNPSLSGSTQRIDHTSPFKERWGGWYVTGTHGRMTHLGNLIAPERGRPIDNGAGHNVKDLREHFNTKPYLTPHSDIVALMVLEHQTGLHNRLARATLEGRVLLYQQELDNRRTKRAATYLSDETNLALQALGDDVLNYLLFVGEPTLPDPVQGTSSFTKDFAQRAKKDEQGRSLRDFDLKTRLFKYPCSYLIYSEPFTQLPSPIKDYVLQRLHAVLIGKEQRKEFAHLSAADRTAIRAILVATMPDLPSKWRAKP